jgi:integrase
MAGQLIKRADSTWLVRVYLGRDGKGRRKYVNRTVHGTKRDAQMMLNRLLVARDTGQVVEQARMTLDAYLDQWLEAAVKPRVRARTHAEYKATLERYVRKPIGAVRLASLRAVDIQDLYTQMQANGQGGMVRLTHTLLKGALRQAVKWEMIAKNPADHVDLPKRQRGSKIRALTPPEVDSFLKATVSSRWNAFFHLLVGTGLRPSEALALTWRDVDLAAGTVTVRRSLGWLRGEKRFVFNDPKTPSSRRTVPLPLGLVRVLADHLVRADLDDLIFRARSGNPAHQRTIVQEAFKPALERAGLSKDVRLYDLRHTHATLLLLTGVNPKVVSERLGHSSVAITLDVYSHVLPNMQAEAAEKLDELLYGDEEEEVPARVAN